MVVDNKLFEIGDFIIINLELFVPTNFISINSFEDDTEFVSQNMFFSKKFRVSYDSIFFTDWYELNDTNIQLVRSSILNNLVFFEFKYERVGTDTSNYLQFNSINLFGNIIVKEYNTQYIENSIFKDLCIGNFETTYLCSNIFRKIYKKGILPEYLERGDSITDDTDFVSFWNSIILFLTTFVTFTKKLEKIYYERDLLQMYMLQYTIYTSENNTTFELQKIISNALDEVRKRGTKTVFLRKNYVFKDESVQELDGEILRLLNISKNDEFLYTLLNKGWNVNNSSPLYLGTCNENNLNKFNYSDLIYFGTGYSLNSDEIIFSKNNSGIGYTDNNFFNGILVNHLLDYEITFLIKIDNANNTNIDFGCASFDTYKNVYSLKSCVDFSQKNNFCENYRIKLSNEFYLIRGIIYGYNSKSMPDSSERLNVATGNNLIFDSENINLIMPFIRVNLDSTSLVTVKDIRITPLRYKNNNCFLNTNNIIKIISNNNNKHYKDYEVENIIKRFLIPYNSTLLTEKIS